MAWLLHHHHRFGIQPTLRPIRSAELAGSHAAPDCEQAAEPMSLPPAAAACSPLSLLAPCNDCPGTPARRCCLVLAASIIGAPIAGKFQNLRSEEHTSELPSLMRNSYAVFCLKKKKKQ